MKNLKSYLENMTKMTKELKYKKQFPYSCFEEFVLVNGKEYKNHNPVKVKYGRMKECFKNAFYLADRDEKYIYVEGFATTKHLGLPLLHAWCVDKQGNVYDPTWRDGDEYYGVPFRMEYVRKTILRKKTFGVIDDWKSGFPLMSGEHRDWLHKPKRHIEVED